MDGGRINVQGEKPWLFFPWNTWAQVPVQSDFERIRVHTPFFWKLIWHYSRTVTRKSGGRSHSKWRHLNWGAVVDGRGPLLWRWAGLTSVCRGCCLQPLEAPFSLSGASSVATCLVVGLGVRSSICCSWWFVWAFIPRLCCLWHRTALVGLWNTVISGYERVLGL